MQLRHHDYLSSSLNGQTIQLNSPNDLSKTLNIHGPGISSPDIRGNGNHRILTLNTGLTSTIRDLALTNRDAGASMRNVLLNSGNLTLQNIRLSSEPNTATRDMLLNSSGIVTMKDAVILQ